MKKNNFSFFYFSLFFINTYFGNCSAPAMVMAQQKVEKSLAVQTLVKIIKLAEAFSFAKKIGAETEVYSAKELQGLSRDRAQEKIKNMYRAAQLRAQKNQRSIVLIFSDIDSIMFVADDQRPAPYSLRTLFKKVEEYKDSTDIVTLFTTEKEDTTRYKWYIPEHIDQTAWQIPHQKRLDALLLIQKRREEARLRQKAIERARREEEERKRAEQERKRQEREGELKRLKEEKRKKTEALRLQQEKEDHECPLYKEMVVRLNNDLRSLSKQIFQIRSERDNLKAMLQKQESEKDRYERELQEKERAGEGYQRGLEETIDAHGRLKQRYQALESVTQKLYIALGISISLLLIEPANWAINKIKRSKRVRALLSSVDFRDPQG